MSRTASTDKPGNILAAGIRKAEITALVARLAALIDQEEQHIHPVPEPRAERLLLTVEEAARRLGIGRTMAFKLIRTGEITTVRIGRLRRVPLFAVEEYAAQLANREVA